ncbi:MAG: ABC transporter permease subunit [Mesorhizobium sp.]|uniref:ABC transporter permease n=1 Tax=Mesorhizobium sp. TaxID=1871066 RepID=UPI000FE79408|nr:ABC transporter permease subunit [Mesorhizobium sp.]RWM02571.1 MAG: ABC transporter permease subunit [Mesorhizobium sp.]TIO48159.1 MAG: ABC transporter permease subunit [Mesorhizobium sp.]TIO56593.1 MAG: ABC transporter permease subunit [Mesorhizobium sp.]TJV58006.1 MAG: ABC transporter permease subunit [Mesorhizobium sp.]
MLARGIGAVQAEAGANTASPPPSVPKTRLRLINARVSRGGAVLLGTLPFAAVAVAYLSASAQRLAVNANDKLLPSPAQMWSAFFDLATVPDKRSGDLILWADTYASLVRLLAGVGLATLTALLLGIAIGFIPRVRAFLLPFVTVVCVIPPLALLPILFIALGLGETAKITLIAIGVAPVMVRDIANRVMELPPELIAKAQTLGGNSWTMVLRLVLPQTMPRLITCVRLALGPAWLFLIAAEAIASTEGLGYRIFLVRRYLSMDVILPYVVWITLLAVATDWLLARLSYMVSPWAHPGSGK